MSTDLTEDEMRRLILALADGMRKDGFTGADAQAVVTWAHEVRVNALLLDMALDRQIELVVHEGKVLVKQPHDPA